MQTLTISEIFKSVQGESTYAGIPCIFIRLIGCNLRCNYCDTTYAYQGGKIITIPEIIDQVVLLNCPLVEITGGEPLLQPAVLPLITKLHALGKTILMETNGSIELPPFPRLFHAIMDVKCPDSGESEKHCYNNFNLLQKGDEIKFVVSSESDIDWAFNLIKKYQLSDKATILFSPVFGRISPQILAERVINSQLNIRMQLQLHKLIWDPEKRGV